MKLSICEFINNQVVLIYGEPSPIGWGKGIHKDCRFTQDFLIELGTVTVL